MSENKADPLLPCPFCGGPAKYTAALSKGYRVECEHCLSQSGWGDYGYIVKNKWNTRAALAAPQSANGLFLKAAFELSCQEQFDLAFKIAENVGYVLVEETEIEPAAAPQPAAPSDFERAFTDAWLQAIADLKKPASPVAGTDRAAIIEECAIASEKIAKAFCTAYGADTSLSSAVKLATFAIRALAGKETGR